MHNLSLTDCTDPSQSWFRKPKLVDSNLKLVVAGLSFAELGTAQAQLVSFVVVDYTRNIVWSILGR